jgi:hypothetical protein
MWTGGATYNYPEFNCCACGKGNMIYLYMILSYFFQGWPLWFVPAASSTATKAVPTIRINATNNINSDQLICHDTYRNTTVCTMKCKALSDNEPVTSLATITAGDFNQSSCTLDWNIENSSFQYILQIPVDNYLIYFTNWTVNDSNLSCVDNTALMTSHMLCRYEVDEKPFSSQEATTYPSTVITLSSSSSEFPTKTVQPAAWQPLNCTNGKIGLNCNVSVDPCLMAKPCLNNGTCVNTNSSYICLCPPSQFTGTYCEINIRPCQPYTCFNHGTCIETNSTSFVCQCEPGYECIHCESLINYCRNVNCQNKGQCRPILLNFTCECTLEDYSGRYCEIKSSSLIAKQTINRSFGYIAILAIILVFGIIISMDILKSVFNIDPAAKERKRLRAKKRRKLRQSIPIRFIYVNEPKHETIQA